MPSDTNYYIKEEQFGPHLYSDQGSIKLITITRLHILLYKISYLSFAQSLDSRTTTESTTQ